jgi:hypothetical protein
VWLANVDRELNIGFYDIGACATQRARRASASDATPRPAASVPAAIELPLSASAIAGESLPITVTLNSNAVTVNTTVTGLGLLKSYLMLCPGQDVPQQDGLGNTIGSLTDAASVTNVFVGETYCMQQVIPSLPSGVTLTQHALFSNGTAVDLVPGASAGRRGLFGMHARPVHSRLAPCVFPPRSAFPGRG